MPDKAMFKRFEIVIVTGACFRGRSPGDWDDHFGIGVVIAISMDKHWFFVLINDDPANAQWYHESNLEAMRAQGYLEDGSWVVMKGMRVDKQSLDEMWSKH